MNHSPFDSTAFTRQDEQDDTAFYITPRFVVHIDDTAIANITSIIRRHVPPQARILDLMSSYRSHLPTDITYEEVVGLGMNASEMQANPQLNRSIVQNLNQNPTLPFADASFDAVLNSVSVQYLTHPVAVFREVARVLKPGGVSIVTFSDRMFPTKAVRVWYEGGNDDHIRLVQNYYQLAGGFSRVDVERYEDPRTSWFARGHDPLFAILGFTSTT